MFASQLFLCWMLIELCQNCLSSIHRPLFPFHVRPWLSTASLLTLATTPQQKYFEKLLERWRYRWTFEFWVTKVFLKKLWLNSIFPNLILKKHFIGHMHFLWKKVMYINKVIQVSNISHFVVKISRCSWF